MPTTSERCGERCRAAVAGAILASLVTPAGAHDVQDMRAGLETALNRQEITAKEAVERIAIRPVTIRDKRQPAPFSVDSVEELAGFRAILATTAGLITIEFMPDIASEHVRNFLRLASLGVFDGVSFHRVVEGMLVQSGWLGSRERPLNESQQRFVTSLQPEFSATPHVRGIVSMARGDDPASASTSFFICTGTVSSLDGEYTVFGRVVDGMTTVDAIESLPLDGETPLRRVELLAVQIVR